MTQECTTKRAKTYYAGEDARFPACFCFSICCYDNLDEIEICM